MTRRPTTAFLLLALLAVSSFGPARPARAATLGIKYYTRTLHGTLDTDILAAMLVAVQNLVRESFRFKAGDLEEMKFGPHELLLAHGETVILVALVPGRYLDRLKSVLAAGVVRLEQDFRTKFVELERNRRRLPGVDGLLDDILRGRTPYRSASGNGRCRVGLAVRACARGEW